MKPETVRISTRFKLYSTSHLKQFIHVLSFTDKLGTLTESLACKRSALIVNKKYTIHLPDKTAKKMEMSIMVHSGFFFFPKPWGSSFLHLFHKTL